MQTGVFRRVWRLTTVGAIVGLMTPAQDLWEGGHRPWSFSNRVLEVSYVLGTGHLKGMSETVLPSESPRLEGQRERAQMQGYQIVQPRKSWVKERIHLDGASLSQSHGARPDLGWEYEN